MNYRVIDNVLPKEQADWFEGIFRRRNDQGHSIGWQYLEDSSGNLKEGERHFPSFVIPVYQKGGDYEYANKELINQIECPVSTMCAKGNADIKTLFRVRVGMHIPDVTWNSHHGPHVDDDHPHNVILYYVNDSDGDTYFFNNQRKVIKRVTPRKNRMVVFDGDILHASSYPIKSSIRITLNLNFRK